MIELERTAQIWAITGNLGGGKSLSAVALAVTSMSRGYFVCSNITLNLDAVASFYGKRVASLYLHIDLDSPDFDPFKLPCGSPRGSCGGKRVLIVLDECAEWVDQYSNAKDARIARLWSWLRHSSKRSQDVLLVVQRMEYLNKVLRLLISRWVVVDDMAIWRIPIVKLRVPFAGDFVMQRVFDRSGRAIYSPQYIRKSVFGGFYNTAECLNKDGASYNVEYSDSVILPRFPARSLILWIATVFTLLYYIVRREYRYERTFAPSPRGRMALRGGRGSAPLGYMASYPHNEGKKDK